LLVQKAENIIKGLCGVIVLTWVLFALARNDAAYPLEKVAEFLVEKLDVTTLPPEIQPRPEKGKKTFQDYGYVTRKLDEREYSSRRHIRNRRLRSGS
jgi:hypothetical protein